MNYVLRRLLPASGGSSGDQSLVEFAYVKTGDEAQWQLLANGSDLAPGEDLLPLFPLAHHDETGVQRTLWSGLIPVARREEYLGKPVSRTVVALADGQAAALRPPAPATPAATKVARTAQLRSEVSEPWKALVRRVTTAAKELNAPQKDVPGAYDETLRILNYNLQFQAQSWLLLLDLYDWIQHHLKPLSASIDAGAPSGLSSGETAVWAWLGSTNADALATAMRNPPGSDPAKTIKPMATSLRDALKRIPAFRDKLEAATIQYNATTTGAADWPDFHFPLAGLTLAAPPAITVAGPYKNAATLSAAGTDVDPNPAITEPSPFPSETDDAETLDKFTALLARALPTSDETDAQPAPFALKLRDLKIQTAGDGGLFVIRMVHVNADCGPLHPPTLSAPSVQFRLASFFDPEALPSARSPSPCRPTPAPRVCVSTGAARPS